MPPTSFTVRTIFLYLMILSLYYICTRHFTMSGLRLCSGVFYLEKPSLKAQKGVGVIKIIHSLTPSFQVGVEVDCAITINIPQTALHL